MATLVLFFWFSDGHWWLTQNITDSPGGNLTAPQPTLLKIIKKILDNLSGMYYY